MGHVDVNAVSYSLPDGRPLLNEVSLRVGEGAKVALIGPNGTGKTSLLRIVSGDLDAAATAPSRAAAASASCASSSARCATTSRCATCWSASPREPIRRAAAAVEAAELAMMERDDEPAQMAYAQALADWGDAGGYEHETLWDVCTVAALGIPFEQAQWRDVRTLSGGEQKRLVLEALLRGPEDVLLLDEPDNYLDVPTKRWLEEALIASPKTVLFVSHDRELLDRVATRIATLEPTAAGSTLWVHPGRLRDLRAGPGRPELPPGGAAPPVGRGARQAQGAGRDVPAEGVVQLGHGPQAAGRRDPAATVRGGRPAGGAAVRAERADAAARAGGPPSGPSSARAWS